METVENPPQPPLLDSLFEELRILPPHPPRREMLAGLRWTSLFRTPTWIIFPVLAFLCFLPFLIAEQAKNNSAQNRRATALVIQVESVEPQQGGQRQFFLKYRFRHDERDYSGAIVTWEGSPLAVLRVGNSLEVAFDEGQPQRSVPAFEKARQEFPWPILVIFPLFFLVFLGPLVVPQLKIFFRARRLFARGHLVTGKVKLVKCTPMQTPFMPYGHFQVIYEFEDESGQLQRGAMRCDNSWLVLQWKPESPVVVAYNPKKPRQNIILEPYVA